MSILWYIGFLALFVIIGGFSLLFRNLVTHRGTGLQLNPPTILIGSYFLYSTSLPVSRLFFGSSSSEFDLVSLKLHLFGFLGIALGAIASVVVTRRMEKNSIGGKSITAPQFSGSISLRTGLFGALLLLLAGRYFWMAMESLNFSIANVLQPYGFEGLEGGGTTDLSNIFVYFGLYSALVFGVTWDRHIRQLPKSLSVAIYMLVIILMTFWILRGSRNMVTILGLPVIAAIYNNKRLSVIKTIAVGFAISILFYMLAGVRNIGLSNASRGDFVEAVKMIDPMNGEFGTSYGVLDHALGFSDSENLLLGKSYTVDLALNMVPRSWWPNRPDNLAVAFSKRYFNTDLLTEGLGFTPVLEAYLNFGQFGIIVMFAMFFGIVTILEDRRQLSDIRGIMLMAFALPMLVNWNRIDMSTAFKMYSGYIAMAFLLPKILIRGNPGRRTP